MSETIIEDVTAPHFEKYATAEQQKAASAERVQNDRELSPDGQARRLAEITADFEAQAAQIQREALAAIDDRAAILSRDAAREKIETSKAMRAEIGDGVYSEFLKADMSRAASPEDVNRAFLDAAPGFDRTVCGLAALARLQGFEQDSHARQIAAEIREALYGAKTVTRQRAIQDLGASRDNVTRLINPKRAAELRARFRI